MRELYYMKMCRVHIVLHFAPSPGSVMDQGAFCERITPMIHSGTFAFTPSQGNTYRFLTISSRNTGT